MCTFSFVLFQRYNSGKVDRFGFNSVAFLHVFLFTLYRASDYFTGNGIDQATIIQLKFGLRGAAFGEYIWLIMLIFGVLFIILAIPGLFIFKDTQKNSCRYFRGKEVTAKGTAFDIGTTILPFIGYSGEIGLGRDLFEKYKEIEKERSCILTRLNPWENEILKFWGQPKIRKSIAVDINNNTISIDKKNYKSSVFIELT